MIKTALQRRPRSEDTEDDMTIVEVWKRHRFHVVKEESLVRRRQPL